MKLQLALDTCNTTEAVNIVKEIVEFVDIIEVGTPMILNYGMETVRVLKKKYPEKHILADLKIMDAGEFEASIAFNSGADIVTVMGVTHDETILGAVKAANRVGGKIVADMMCVENLEDRATKLLQLGAHYVCIHTAVDIQGIENTFDALQRVQKRVGSKFCAIAGGINENSIGKVVDYRPEIIIVGKGITGKVNKRECARKIFEAIKLNN